MERLGEKIRKIRELKGYSQEYVATRLSISQNAVSKLENGCISIDIEKLIKLSEIFEISIDKILSFDEASVLGNEKNEEDRSLEHSYSMHKMEELYERLLKQSKEEADFLKQLLMNQKSH